MGEDARSKLTQIYRYLQALHARRNPVVRRIEDQPWREWLRDLPNHPMVARRSGDENGDGEFILKVCRPERVACPRPPDSILDWLEPGWDQPEQAARVVLERAVTDSRGEGRIERFDEDGERSRDFDAWLDIREKWAAAEAPARAARALFERLYALHARLEREGERIELVVGDGLLEWDRPDGISIRHPLLLQRIELLFDPVIPEFTLVESDQPPELYTAIFAGLDDVPHGGIGESQAELDERALDPMSKSQETNEFLRKLIIRISAGGQFLEDDADPPPDVPSLRRAPVIFLRNRTLGLSDAIAKILDDLQEREDLPDAVLRIVGIAGDAATVPASRSSYGSDEEVLFSKEANSEQIEVAQRLARHGSVLVQGPPGTGKTHTIANLVGHLLAQGKTVLVTSHTAKALTVLREKIAEPLQPLCLSVGVPVRDPVTGNTNAAYGQKQMNQAIEAISARLAASSPEALMAEADQLESARHRLIEKRRERSARLHRARFDEYRPIVLNGVEYSPAEAARKVANCADRDSWIPGPIALERPLPLTSTEVAELYATNSQITEEDERELEGSLPNPQELPSPSEFEALCRDYRDLSTSPTTDGKALWVEQVAPVEELKRLAAEAVTAFAMLESDEEWCWAAVSAGRDGGSARAAWEDLLEEIEHTAEVAAAAKEAFYRYGPTLPQGWEPEHLVDVLREIESHLSIGGKLRGLALLLNGRWKGVIEAARVEGRKPANLEEFEALRLQAELLAARQALVSRWERQMTGLGAPPVQALGEEPEVICLHFKGRIEACLAWYHETWRRLEDELVEAGFRPSSFIETSPLRSEKYGDLRRMRDAFIERLPGIFDAQIRRLQLDAFTDVFERLDESLSRHTMAGPESLVARLRGAVRSHNAALYHAEYDRLAETMRRRSYSARRSELLRKLDAVAPGWAEAIRTRSGVHGLPEPPGDAAQAWLWRQLRDELDRRAAVSLVDLQEELCALADEERRITTKLIEKRGWAHQALRTTQRQRQALGGWKVLMDRVGAGTGKRAPELRAEARRLMPECQSAVPVWIMPLSLVAQNFHPAKNRFDVVIIDEASQADAMALVALYLGNQVVVVGDSEQVSPEGVGQAIANIDQLIETHLRGIPNRKLYDPQLSVYDLAATSFEGNVMLREHFRCVPEIIEFSNQLSYDGKIRPLREAGTVKTRPFTVAYRVEGLNEQPGINRIEAECVASLLIACTEQPEYTGATFGVISLVGSEQALLIESILRMRMPAEEYVARMIRCGNSADFQGDERDVMFLSVVDAPAGSGPLPLRREGPFGRFKKRFNVAASRAGDQMWVVYSLDHERDLQPGDLRRRLIEHALNPTALSQRIQSSSKRAESEFERQVLSRLMRRGYQATPQFEVGAYRIDIVVEGAGGRLAVECDGDRWHTDENLAEDMERQAILERLGWQFFRIRGSQFFRNPEETLQPLFDRLAEMGIEPNGEPRASMPDAAPSSELLERVKRRAAELREEWRARPPEPPSAFPEAPSGFGARHQKGNVGEEADASVSTNGGVSQAGRAWEPPRDVPEPPSDFDASPVATDTRVLREGGLSAVAPSPQARDVAADLPGMSAETRRPTSSKVADDDERTLIRSLKRLGVRYVDKRPSGGALWVIGGEELRPLMKQLAEKGFKFTYTSKGGRATKRRPGWWLA